MADTGWIIKDGRGLDNDFTRTWFAAIPELEKDLMWNVDDGSIILKKDTNKLFCMFFFDVGNTYFTVKTNLKHASTSQYNSGTMYRDSAIINERDLRFRTINNINVMLFRDAYFNNAPYIVLVYGTYGDKTFIYYDAAYMFESSPQRNAQPAQMTYFMDGLKNGQRMKGTWSLAGSITDSPINSSTIYLYDDDYSDVIAFPLYMEDTKTDIYFTKKRDLPKFTEVTIGDGKFLHISRGILIRIS